VSHIDDKTEQGIQTLFARNKGKSIDGAVIHVIFGLHETIRYIDGGKHLTGGCWLEFIGEPWYYWYSRIARELFAPRGVVVTFDVPVCWDNETMPIPEQELRVIFSRIERSFGKKYKRCRFVLEPQETAQVKA
jgi:hypothetical protein